MKAPQIAGIVAVVVVLAGLVYYESRRLNSPESETFAPAQSADESVPAGDTPIEPPAAVTAAPADEALPSDEPAMADTSSEAEEQVAIAVEPDEPMPEPETVDDEGEPGDPVVTGRQSAPDSEAPAADEPDIAVAEPKPEPEPEAVAMAEAEPEPEGPALERQTPAVDPAEAEAEGEPADAPAEKDVAVIEEAVEAETMAPAPEPALPEAEDDAAVAMVEPEPAPAEDDTDTEAAGATEDPAEQPAMEVEATPEAPVLEDEPADEVEIAVVEPPVEPPADEEVAVVELDVVPTFDVVRVEPTGEAVVAGLAAPGSIVEIMDGPTVVAAAVANQRGEWALALDQPLPPGTHDLAIRTTSEDRSVVTLSDQRVAVSVPEVASEEALVVLNRPDSASSVLQVPGAGEPEPEAPELGVAVVEESPPTEPEAPMAAAEPEVAILPDAGADTDGQTPPADVETAESVAAVDAATAEEPAELAEPMIGTESVADEGPAPAQPEAVVEAAPAPEAVSPDEAVPAPEIGVAAVEADTAGGLFVAGTAETEETVRVYVDDEFVGEAQPTESGTWLVEVRREMPEGTYSVRADQVEEGTGAVIARAEVPFEREIAVATLEPTATTDDQTGADVSAAIAGPETVIIKRGDNLWRIARRIYGRGVRYSTIYQANREQIRNPHWIYPGQVFVLPEGDADWNN